MASKLKTVAEMTPEEVSVKIAEYQSAEAMLCHYDNLNWKIGSIFIAGVVLLTGVVLNKDFIEAAEASKYLPHFTLFIIPAFSLFILYCWYMWFERHRGLYNFRNEVLHRLEIQLGMYNHLLNIDKLGSLKGVKNSNKKKMLEQALREAKENAGHHEDEFRPFFSKDNDENEGKEEESFNANQVAGRNVAKYLTFGIPFFQFIFILGVFFESFGKFSYAFGALWLCLMIGFITAFFKKKIGLTF